MLSVEDEIELLGIEAMLEDGATFAKTEEGDKMEMSDEDESEDSAKLELETTELENEDEATIAPVASIEENEDKEAAVGINDEMVMEVDGV